MRKYHQLLLLIISFVSLLLFLVYRREYNRLHYVLEVFNFFGQPCNVSELQQNEYVLAHHDWGPIPVWQETEHNYVYSAFLINKKQVKALALVEDDTQLPRNCYLWFDDKKRAVSGKFMHLKVDTYEQNVKLKLYFYVCSFSSSTKLAPYPYAVSFSYKLKRENDLKKIMVTDTFDRNEIMNNTTVCVSPSVYSKRRLIEFLSYHMTLGVNSFIFYNKNIPHKLMKSITNLSTRLDLQVTFYPWNFPKIESPLTRNVIENDCLLRTAQQTNYVIILEMNEYIVPTLTYKQLTEDLDWKSRAISLPVQKFCINKSDVTKPIPLQNVETINDNEHVVQYMYRNDNVSLVISRTNQGIGSIHKYVHCDERPTNSHIDKSILKFSTDFTRSTLFQFFMHNQI